MALDRRKDTPHKGTVIPRDYLKLVEDVFNKSFSKHLMGAPSPKSKSPKAKHSNERECFVAFGEIYPDELILAISLKNPGNLRMTTCYASVDYPPTGYKPEPGKPASTSEMVQHALNFGVDIIAGFFSTFFNDGRPLDYENEYKQNWTRIEMENKVFVHVRINHDNLELESQADAILSEADDDFEDDSDASSSKKKNYH